jgi:hypothetical protein
VPIAVSRDDGRHHLTATASGQIDTAAFGEFIRTARAGELRTYTLLIDARTATFDITAGDLETLILPIIQRLRAANDDRAPVAFVVTDTAALPVARAFETLVEGHSGVVYLGVFRDVVTADAWLASTRDPRR